MRASLDAAGMLGQPLLAAVSGGADSLALLVLLADLRDAGECQLHAVHVEHGISPGARAGRDCAAALAETRGVPLHIVPLALGPDASETTARRERYRALRRMRRETGCAAILLAHHADDQAETVLLRVLAGSGPAGLAAMQERRGALIRPLLGVPRTALAAECRRRGIAVWDDPANHDARHARSWVRQELLPLLRRRDADVDTRLQRLAEHAQADRAAWQSALGALPELDLRALADGRDSIVAHALGRYDSALASALIRALGFRAGCPIGPQRAERVRRWIVGATRGGWMPLGGRWRAELVQGRLSFQRAPRRPAAPVVIGERPSGVADFGGWQVRWETFEAEAAVAATRSGAVQEFAEGRYLLRHAAPGDRIVPLGGTGRRRVVRCLQDAGVSGGRRADWPVMVSEESVVWVAGICRGTDRLPVPGQRRMRVAVEQC